MENFDYEKNLRSLEFAKYHFNAIYALLGYKSDRMMELNKTRFLGDVDLVIETLQELKSEFNSK